MVAIANGKLAGFEVYGQGTGAFQHGCGLGYNGKRGGIYLYNAALARGHIQVAVVRLDIEYGCLSKLQGAGFAFILPVEQVDAVVVMAGYQRAGAVLVMQRVHRVWKPGYKLT